MLQTDLIVQHNSFLRYGFGSNLRLGIDPKTLDSVEFVVS